MVLLILIRFHWFCIVIFWGLLSTKHQLWDSRWDTTTMDKRFDAHLWRGCPNNIHVKIAIVLTVVGTWEQDRMFNRAISWLQNTASFLMATGKQYYFNMLRQSCSKISIPIGYIRNGAPEALYQQVPGFYASPVPALGSLARHIRQAPQAIWEHRQVSEWTGHRLPSGSPQFPEFCPVAGKTTNQPW